MGRYDYYAKVIKFSISSQYITNFLVNNDISPKNEKDIIKGFNIVGDFLDKTIIKPNNKSYPSSRNDFVNLLK